MRTRQAALERTAYAGLAQVGSTPLLVGTSQPDPLRRACRGRDYVTPPPARGVIRPPPGRPRLRWSWSQLQCHEPTALFRGGCTLGSVRVYYPITLAASQPSKTQLSHPCLSPHPNTPKRHEKPANRRVSQFTYGSFRGSGAGAAAGINSAAGEGVPMLLLFGIEARSWSRQKSVWS